MTATCKTCRWLLIRTPDQYEEPYGECEHPELESILSGVKTVPLDFGCIHHEPIKVDLANSTHKWFRSVEYEEPKELTNGAS